MMCKIKIRGKGGNKIIPFFLVLVFLYCVPGVVSAKEPEVTSAKAETIYLNTQDGMDRNSGLSADAPVGTLEEALARVADAGVIRLVDTMKITQDVSVTKNVVFKFVEPESMIWDNVALVEVDGGADVYLDNVVFDGEGRTERYYGMFNVYSGALTLGGNTEVKNFKSTSYGAVIGIYTGAVVNLNGAEIANNSSGKLGDSYCGGITVAGTLNIGAGTVITGNVMNNNVATDILLTSDGIVNLDGGAAIGTLAFASAKPDKPQLFISSVLMNNINMRMQKYYGTNVMPSFNPGNVLASGTAKYEITDVDLEKIKLPNPRQHQAVKNEKKEAYVVGVPYKVIIKSMEGGTVRSDSDIVKYGESTNLIPDANAGYKYKEGTIVAHEEGNPNSQFSLAENQEQSSWTLTMNRESNVEVGAEFEKIPAVTPNLKANLPTSKNTIEGAELKLQVEVEEALGNTLSYQWFKNGKEIPGETQATLIRKAASALDAGSYYVQVTNTTVAAASAFADSSICAVKVAQKTVEVESPKEINGKVENKAQLWDSALTEAEKKEYQEQGTDISVYMEMKILDTSADQQYIENALGDKKLGQLLDISVFKKIGELDKTNVTKLSEEITIGMNVPVELLPKAGEKRVYSIVRIHKSESGTVQTDILEDLDTDADKVTFKTDLFSTYALIYSSKIQINANNPSNLKTVETGDTQSVVFPVLAGLSSLLIIGAIRARSKSK